MNRYIRQINLPEIGLTGQEKLSQARIIMVGAGGLGAPALPYLAAAGVGNITIIDHDNVDIHNLHRQTIYRTDQTGQSKAELTASYLRALNPDITVTAITEKLTAHQAGNFDLILDGSDNFTTKSLLNDMAITVQTPLITASVNQWGGQIGIFEGHHEDYACYRCLFPEFPLDARNCNEAGILGTSAGLVGTLQAHLALCYILGIEGIAANNFYTINLKTMRIETIKTGKDKTCLHCANTHKTQAKPKENIMVNMISIENLHDQPTTIIDVRGADEIADDPLRHPLITQQPLHIPLPEFVARINELPDDTRLAFICAGNIRSRQAADYLAARGYDNVCVLDKFSL